jgi:peptidoglycan/LPS O-acetylase OafA/YrhL
MIWYHVAAAVFYFANMVKKWHRHRTAILLCVFLATPVFRGALYAFKLQSGVAASLPAYADQLAIGCLLAMFASRLPKVSGSLAVGMVLAVVFVPWYPATSPARTLFMLLILRPLLHVSLAGLVLHVIQVPYRILNWSPVAWLGRISYGLYLWQELFCSNAALHLGLVLPALVCACLSACVRAASGCDDKDAATP